MIHRALAAALAAVVVDVCGIHGAAADPGPSDPTYGSGHHGEWITDEFGLPAYRFMGCTASPCLPADDAVHRLGNGSAHALAHADGYVELYDARSYHRFANRYDEATGGFAGGFGWVRDGEETWSTLYRDRPADTRYDRVFGMGYFKKTIVHNGLAVEDYVYLTEGDDAVLREHLVFTNESDARKAMTYFDHWDVGWWLPRTAFGLSLSSYDAATVKTAYDGRRGVLEAVSQAPAGDPNRPDFWTDPTPQTSFVAYRGERPDAFETVQRAFVGAGARALPDAVARGHLKNGLDASGTLANPDAVLVTQKSFVLAPGERRVVDVVYGLAPRGESRATLDRVRAEPAFTLPRIAARWALTTPKVHFVDAPWLGREMAWSYAYLRSGALRDDYFGAHVLNQGSIYLYELGTNSGPRTTFRHLLPLIYTDPELAKESLRYFLRAMKPTGELPYATSGHGASSTLGFTPSDQTYGLLSAALEYLHVTRDDAFLDERVDFWCEAGRGACGGTTVYGALAAAYAYSKIAIGTGEHGLVRLANSDWDDFLVLLAGDPITTAARGESTMNTGLALWTLPPFADLADARGDVWTARAARADVAALRVAMRAQWRGDHVNRGYTFAPGGTSVELGAASVWIASNAAALLAPGFLSAAESSALSVRIAHDNLDPSPVGLAAIGSARFEGGTPGNWYSLTGPTVEGLLAHDQRALAWQLFVRQTLANHATVHPEYAYGIWTGPDMYFTPLDEAAGLGRAGSTWCFPTLCMQHLPFANAFAHAEPLLASLRLAGVRADAGGMTIDPSVPSRAFSWVSPSFAWSTAPRRSPGGRAPSRPRGSSTASASPPASAALRASS